MWGLGDGIDLNIGELEFGELQHVGLAIAAKLLGHTVQFGLQLPFNIGIGVHQLATAAGEQNKDYVEAHQLMKEPELTRSSACTRALCLGTAAGWDRRPCSGQGQRFRSYDGPLCAGHACHSAGIATASGIDRSLLE